MSDSPALVIPAIDAKNRVLARLRSDPRAYMQLMQQTWERGIDYAVVQAIHRIVPSLACSFEESASKMIRAALENERPRTVKRVHRARRVEA
jgi:hypothetical protein